jgi:putative sigma-54 modulation protein
MKLVYTGREAEFPPNQAKKLDAKLARISKLLGRGEREAHVMLTKERFLHQARINVNVWDHHMVALGADADLFTAVSGAVDNLEKQLAKLRTKWRDTKRHKDAPQRTPEGSAKRAEAVENGAAPKAPSKAAKSKAAVPAKRAAPKVFRVGRSDVPDYRLKPMTVDEAMIEIDADEDYFVFEEAGSGRRNVLLRRKDGHFDLIES